MLLRGALAAKFATLEFDLRKRWRPALSAEAASDQPAIEPVRRALCPPPKIIYRAETTEIAATLASTGVSPSGKAVSMRITCPACGDCMPSFLASVSMRSGSRSEASSSRSAHQQKQATQRDAELLHLAAMLGIFDFHQA